MQTELDVETLELTKSEPFNEAGKKKKKVQIRARQTEVKLILT